MKEITPPLNTNNSGQEVTNLQDGLLLLLRRQFIRVADTEQQVYEEGLRKEQVAQVFGDSTQKLVTIFQEQSGLRTTGEVDESTAESLNKVLKELGAFDPPPQPTQFIVQGQVLQSDRTPVMEVIVRAFDDRNIQPEELLGETTTNKDGYYEIRYSAEQFRRSPNERGGPDLIVKVYDSQGQVVATSPKKNNAKAEETTDLRVTIPETEPQEDAFVVKGIIRLADGFPASTVMMSAFDRDLRNEQLLGQKQTDNKGFYQIQYSASQFRRQEKGSADLVVKAFAANGSLLAASPVLFNAPPVAEIDLTIPSEVQQPATLFEKITQTLEPLLEGLHVEELEENEQHQDISFLAGETGFGKTDLARFVIAHKVAQQAIQPEFWFALLGGSFFQFVENQSLQEQLTTILNSLSSLDAATVRKAMTRSFNQKEIPEPLRESVSSWVEAFLQFIARRSVSESAEPTFVKLALTDAGIRDAQKQEKFARLFNQYKALTPELLGALEQDQSFTTTEIADLHTSFQLSDLTRGDFSIVKTIKEEFGVRQPEQIRTLAKRSEREWVNLIAVKHAAGEINLPIEVSPIAEQVRLPEAEVYGKNLERQFREAFPTTAFTGGLERALQNGGVHGLRQPEVLGRFLNRHESFELLNTPVDDFMNNSIHPDFQELAQDENFRLEVKAAQRVFKLVPTFEATDALLADDLHSAQKIYRTGESEFVRRYGDHPGFTPEAARLAWNRAADTHAAVLTIVTDLKALEAEALPSALSSGSEALESFPNWSNLFATGDLCDCEHCRSVLSPAAYFADLLMFLKDRKAANPALTVKDILFRRRPDLGFLELNCDNALVPLPYIDVVCEVLEAAVDSVGENDLELINFTSIPTNSIAAKTAVSTAFQTAFSNPINDDKEKIDLDANFSLSQVNALDPDRWVVHGDNVTYLLKKKPPSANFFAEIIPNTKASADELRAYPQYVNPNVYEKLRQAKYPMTLPFDLFAEEVRTGFQKTNLQRWDLMRTFQGSAAPNNPTDGDIAAEYFGISISANPTDPSEKNLILVADSAIAVQQIIWGETSANWLDTVANVNNFLQKTSLEYNDLLALLDLKFINPRGNITIQHLDASCDTDKKVIQMLDALKLDRIHRFLRLWRKLKNWKMWELDLVIRQPGIGNRSDTGEWLLNELFLVNLFYFSQLKNKLGGKTTVEQVCALFGNLNTETRFTKLHKKREDALYQNLFLNTRLIKPLDPTFEVAKVDVVEPTTEKISSHYPVIVAALGIREASLVLLKGLSKASDGKPYITDDLTLTNLSFLWRHAWLSKVLKFKVEDWELVLKLFQQDILQFVNPQSAWEFIKKIDQLKDAGFTPDELNWLLASDRTAKSAIKETDAVRFLAALRKELETIKTDFVVALPTDVDSLSALLTSLLQKLNRSEAEVNSFLKILRGSVLLEVNVQDLPVGFAFPAAIVDAPNYIPIQYDEPKKLFRFTGLMTDDQRKALTNDASPVLVTLYGSGQLETTVQGMPAGFTFPASIIGAPHNIPIQYDELNHIFEFIGVMTDVQLSILLSDASLASVVGISAYQDSIKNLYQKSLKVLTNYRGAIEELYQQSLEALTDYLSMERNVALPGDFIFPATITGTPNAIPIRYEQVLRFTGVMTAAQKNILLTDPSLTAVKDIDEYKKAIEKLFTQPGKPAVVTNLPTGFTFPATITDPPNAIPIGFEQTLRFMGVMTAAQKNTLLNDPSLLSVTGIPAYKAAIAEFFHSPRMAVKFFELVFTTSLAKLPAEVDFKAQLPADLADKITYDAEQQLLRFTGILSNTEKTDILALSSDPAYVAAVNSLATQPQSITSPLAKLPAGVDFKAQLPADLAAKITYDAEQQLLRFTGILSNAEKIDILALSSDPAYVAAVNSLATQPQIITSPDDRIWLTDSDLDITQPDNDTYAKRLANAAKKALSYLSKTLAEKAVVQQTSIQLGLTEAVCRYLLTQYAVVSNSPDSAKTLLLHLTGNFTIDSTTINAWFWANRVAAIWKKRKIALAELKKITTLTVGAQLLDFLTLPFDNTGAIAPIDLFLRTNRLIRLQDSLPETEITLLEVLEKLNQENLNPGTYTANTFADDVERLNEAWIAVDVNALTASLDLTYPADYLLAESWERLRRTFYFLDNLNGSADTVKQFAAVTMGFENAKTLKELLRSKFGTETWLTLSAEIQDVLRERKRDALAAYLLTQPQPNPPSDKWENTNDLYAYYLLDVEMCSCQLTSRLVQASGSVQLFVQRCFMGLESDVKVKADGADGDSAWRWWKWMRKYRVWEANRKVFLWPENWIEPELKKDRSPFFKDLENELLQNEINQDTVEKAFINYLEKLDGVAQLEIAGFYQEDDGDNAIVHVFGRTQGAEPHLYYYRSYDYRQWTPWEKVDLDIQGDYLIPAVVNKRLFLFWPIFTEIPDETGNTTVRTPPLKSTEGTFTPDKTKKKLRLQMAVSDYRQGKWTPKRVSKDFAESQVYEVEIVRKHYNFFPIDRSEIDGRFGIKYEGYSLGSNGLEAHLDGTFEISGCKGVPELTDLPGNFKPAIRPKQDSVDYYTTFLKWIERAYPQNDFTLENTFSTQSESLRFTPVLMHTPGIFKMTPPWQLSYLDKLLLDGQMAIAPQSNAKYMSYVSQRFAPLGTWLPFFYNDKNRTFFVLPSLPQIEVGLTYSGSLTHVGTKKEIKIVGNYYYPQIKGFFRWWETSFEGLVQKGLDALDLNVLAPTPATRYQLEDSLWKAFPEEAPPPLPIEISSPYTPEQVEKLKNLMKRWFMRFFHYYLGAVSLLLFQFRQFHFKNFYHPFVCDFAKLIHNPLKGIPALMSRETQLKNTSFQFFNTYQPTPSVVWAPDDPKLPAYPKEDVDFTPDGAYSPYNWELFFHTPLLIANSLSKNQRFEEARDWYHFIFNPIGVESKTPGSPALSKYWITKPFFETTDQQYIQQRIDNILRMLAGDTSVGGTTTKDELEKQVYDWRTNPFEPHRIANYRTVAYQKTVVMKYLDNLIAWGDNLFRQDSMESINEATQLYILAAEILGPRPQKIPPRAKPPVESFNELETKFDEFSNALVQVENLVPVMSGNGQNGTDPAPLPMLYFCIPQNDKMLGYWDTVADRLYKIRHCMNIEGVVRQLALFEPPIDPAALVKAVAGGVDISSALADLNAPLPLYRFNVLLQKANEVCNDVKALGNALLSALEKKDAEAMGLLRQSQEIKLLEAVKALREQQINEAKENAEGIRRSRNTIEERKNYYRDIEKVSGWEKASMVTHGLGIISEVVATILNATAGTAHLIPEVTVGVEGFGGSPVATVKYGGDNVGKSAFNWAAFFSGLGGTLHSGANLMATQASNERRWEDWKLQERLAEKELLQMDKQIAAAELRIAIAEKELENHVIQIENAKTIDEFMRSKYTNQELYQWQIGQISGVYFQSYRLAYDLAKRAERCFRFELGLQDSSYINFGYWDSLKKGLLSGEKLQYDLRRLETAYLEQNRREFELTKHISLTLLDPLALIKLRETGRCFINLQEEIFDLDYPGHYFRRIKSVSLTLPCVVGPYTTISCTLRLLKNSIRINTKNGDNGYPRNTDGDGLPADDDRFIENSIPVKAIAASNAQNDSGMFELSFRDERYLPFEGAGAISDWSIELFSDLPSNNPDSTNPDFGKPLRQFDYGTISDAILHIKYTAREDAGVFKNGAIAHLRDYFSQDGATPSLRMFNLRQEFPTQWHHFLHPTNPADGNVLELDMSPNLFPIRDKAKTLKVNTICLLARCTDTGSYEVTIAPPLPAPSPPDQDPNKMTLAPANQYGGLHFSQKNGLGIEVVLTAPPIKWQLRMTRPDGEIIEVEDLLLVLGYEWE
ncbi:neuraminidase-like domain-containing protein [Nostoc flagelliforme]|nr:neuraminidase-like domain-containing protein [Nostoc flagelliforme]